LTNAEQKFSNLEKKYFEDIEDLKMDLDDRSNCAIKDIAILEDDNEKLKNSILDLEKDLSDVSSNYERDKALWKEKFEFLQNQKKQAKEDLKEAQKKFELTIEQLQRKENNDKGKVESAQIVLINSIEKKYKDQIRDIIESHNVRE
jgi:multidrug resistance efflux pump